MAAPEPPAIISERPLAGRRVAVLEHRELDRLGQMLEAQGAETLRCPLLAIADAPEAAPVVAWLRRFIASPPDDLVLLTGEGLRRLFGFAERESLAARFREALGQVRTITRGPKPARALREVGLAPALRADPPTMAGVVAALAASPLRGRRVAAQLYPEAPPALVDFLGAAGAAADPVVPYIYVPAADDAAIRALIAALAGGQVDAIAFTSAAQVARLFAAADLTGLGARLRAALRATRIAAVGPIVAAALHERALPVAIMPRDRFFMKPLVGAIAAALAP